LLRVLGCLGVVLGCLGIVGGIILACWLPALRQRAADLAREPQRISLRDLADKGPGDNPHVIVTDFTCAKYFAYTTQTRRGERPDPDRMASRKAWIPLLPKAPVPDGGKEPALPPGSIKVLLETPQTLVGRAVELHVLSRRPSIEGLATRLSERGLPSDIRATLSSRYPDTDFESCILVEEIDRYQKGDAPLFAKLVTAGAGGGVLVGGAVLLLGLFFLLLDRRRNLTTVPGGEHPVPG